MKQGIAIIGAGHAGSQAAASLRQVGYDGPVYLFSDEPQIPYHKPPLSKGFLDDVEMKPQLLRAEQFYRDNAIELALGTKVHAIDRHATRLKLDRANWLSVDRIILATGARARGLPTPEAALDGAFSLRTLSDAEKLRHAARNASNVVVVGGGFIGLEVAATLAAQGKRVTVIEAADRLLGRAVSEIVSRYIRRYLEGFGIEIRTSARIGEIKVTGSHISEVKTADGLYLTADVLLVGIGAEPAIELAVNIGVACDNGITVDAQLRASRSDIFAIGDCAYFPHLQTRRLLRLESVQNATDQARHVAKAILGCSNAYRETAWFWSDQAAIKLQIAGVAFDDDQQVISGKPDNDSFSVFRFKGERLLSVESVNSPAEHMVARRMIALDCSPSAEEIKAGVPRLKQILAARQLSINE